MGEAQNIAKQAIKISVNANWFHKVYFPFLCADFPFDILRYGGISITWI